MEIVFSEDVYYWSLLSVAIGLIVWFLLWLGSFILSIISKRYKEFFINSTEYLDSLYGNIFVWIVIIADIIYCILDLFGIIEFVWFIP